jgi:hypothetical protein
MYLSAAALLFSDHCPPFWPILASGLRFRACRRLLATRSARVVRVVSSAAWYSLKFEMRLQSDFGVLTRKQFSIAGSHRAHKDSGAV